MSYDKPLGNNNTPNTSTLFRYRKSYEEDTLPLADAKANSYINLGDHYPSKYEKVPFTNLYENNILYGTIDLEGYVIVPKSPNFAFKTLSSPTGEHRLLNFVADAYSDMKEYLRTAVLTGKISDDSDLIKFNIYKSYIDPQIYVLSAFNLYADNFKRIITQNKLLNSKIINYKTFNEHYINYLKSQIKYGINVTKSSMIMNNFFLNYSSGLMFDISANKADDDLIKRDQYLLTDEFRIFQNACTRYGFKIDQNVPWRLIADVESPAMKPYLDSYLLKSTKDLFNKYFRRVYVDEISHLKYFFLNSYNYFVKNNEYFYNDLSNLTYEQLKINLEYNNNTSVRQASSEQEYFAYFKDDYWLRLYVYFNNIESNKNLTQQSFENIIREASYILACKQDNSMTESLKYIQKYFKSHENITYFRNLLNNEIERSNVQEFINF